MENQHAKAAASRNTHPVHVKNIVKLFNELRHRHDLYRVFSDCMEMMALALSNAVDKAQFEVREARYMQIIKAYTRDELTCFSNILAETQIALGTAPGDLLGAVFGELEVHNKYRGQFFTPYEICTLMARMQVGDGERMREIIAANGFVTVSEPACGAGAMVIAFAEAMIHAGFNPCSSVHVTAADVDSRAAHMAYVQLSLMGIPAVVIVGNTLTLEEREHFYTPAHVLGGWRRRLGMVPGGKWLATTSESAEPVPASATSQPELPQLQLF